MNSGEALVLVDLQNDFFPPNGSLPVSGGNEIIGTVNRYIGTFLEKGLPVFASRDWHPQVSRHFKMHGGKWPPHCVQNTWGAEFHSGIRMPENVIVLSKGMDPEEEEGYTAFQGHAPDGRHFKTVLDVMGIKVLYVAGLATDYCVRWTVLDSCRSGLETFLLLDAVRGVNIMVNDDMRAIDEMLRACAKTATLATAFLG